MNGFIKVMDFLYKLNIDINDVKIIKDVIYHIGYPHLIKTSFF